MIKMKLFVSAALLSAVLTIILIASITAGEAYGKDKNLFEAADTGDAARVEELLSLGVKVKYVFEGGWTAVKRAAYKGHTAVVEVLLNRGADGDDALLYAAWGGREETVLFTLDWGADIDAQRSGGFTALMLAAMEGHTDVIRLLASKGADAYAEDFDGRTAFDHAAGGGDDALGTLMDAVAKRDEFDMQLVTYATAGDLAGVEKMLLSGARVDYRDEKRLTALMWASYNGHLDVVKALIGAMADVNYSDDFGQTALMFAAWFGHKDIAEVLLADGAECDYTNTSGETALIWAAKRGHTGLAELLIRMGADTTIEDDGGVTAVEYAAERARRENEAIPAWTGSKGR